MRHYVHSLALEKWPTGHAAQVFLMSGVQVNDSTQGRQAETDANFTSHIVIYCTNLTLVVTAYL